MMQSYGQGPAGRELILLALPSLAELPAGMSLPTPHFTCLLVVDALHLPDRLLFDVASYLLDQGLAASNCWGPDCSRVDAAMDLAIVARTFVKPMPQILTNCYPKEALDEALWAAIFVTQPDDANWETCGTCLVICVGNEAWAAQIDLRLRDVKQLSRDVCGG